MLLSVSAHVLVSSRGRFPHKRPRVCPHTCPLLCVRPVGGSPTSIPARAQCGLPTHLPTIAGTPRQSGIAPAVRGRLVMESHVPLEAFEGLEQYTHVWLVFVFHVNTNLARQLQSGRAPGLALKGVPVLRHPLHVPFPPQACICARVSPAPHLCDSG
jgi:hypothetical protein